MGHPQRPLNIIRVLAFLIANAAMAMAGSPKAVDPDTIKDKVNIPLHQEFTFQFNREKNKLLQPAKIKETDDKKRPSTSSSMSPRHRQSQSAKEQFDRSWK